MELCIPFRDGILERLDEFATEAIEEQLDGVDPIRKKMHTNKILEVGFTLNDFGLVLMATDDVFPVNMESEALASKMFIYFEGDENNAPHMEITVLGPHEGTFVYQMTWFAQEQPVHIVKGRSVTRDDGQAAANALLHHVHGFRTLWMQRPTLGQMRQRKYETHALGFHSLSHSR